MCYLMFHRFNIICPQKINEHVIDKFIYCYVTLQKKLFQKFFIRIISESETCRVSGGNSDLEAIVTTKRQITVTHIY